MSAFISQKTHNKSNQSQNNHANFYLCCLTGFSSNLLRSSALPNDDVNGDVNGAVNGTANGSGAGAGLSGCGGISGTVALHDGELNDVCPI